MAPQTHPLSGHLGWSSWRAEWRSWWLKKKKIPAKVESSNRETMLVWRFSWTVSWKRWVTHHCWFGPAGDEKLGPCSSSQFHPALFTLTGSRTWSSKLQLLKKGSGLHSKQSLWAGVLLIAVHLSPRIHHFILPTWSSQKPSHPPGGNDRTGELGGWPLSQWPFRHTPWLKHFSSVSGWVRRAMWATSGHMKWEISSKKWAIKNMWSYIQ